MPKLMMTCLVCSSLLVISSQNAQNLMAQERAVSSKTPPGKEFVYKTSHGQAQKIEVYFPVNHDPANHDPVNHDPVKSKVPGLLLFHGGGWRNGNLSSFRYVCQYFAKRGLVTATANYYMHPEEEAKALPQGVSKKRVCVTDAKSAIRWMKQHAGELGFDPNRLIVGGSSAGGHVAVLGTLNPGLNDPTDPMEFNTDVVAYMLFNPALTNPGEDGDDEVDVFPYVKAGIAPSIMFFGSADKWNRGSLQLVPKLHELKSEANLYMADGQGHTFYAKQPFYDSVIIEADKFLVSHHLLTGESPLPPVDEKYVLKLKE
jgi:dienelactone hydrolase